MRVTTVSLFAKWGERHDHTMLEVHLTEMMEAGYRLSNVEVNSTGGCDCVGRYKDYTLIWEPKI